MPGSKEEWLKTLEGLLGQSSGPRHPRRRAIANADEYEIINPYAAAIASPPNPQREIQDAMIAAMEAMRRSKPPLEAARACGVLLAEKYKSLSSKSMWKGMRSASGERTHKRRRQVRAHLKSVRKEIRQLDLVLPTRNPDEALRAAFADPRYDSHKKLMKMNLPALGEEYAAVVQERNALSQQADEAEQYLKDKFGEDLPVPLPGVQLSSRLLKNSFLRSVTTRRTESSMLQARAGCLQHALEA